MADSDSDIPREMQLVRQARSKFLSMAVAYSLGVFNDNFFKQAALLLAVEANREEIGGVATILFTLPFILLAAPAGWLADRFPKRTVILAAKGLEIVAMAIGGLGLTRMNWPLMLTMVTLMGIHSTIFSPSLNGSIPELYPESYVTRANAKMKLATTAAILLAIALAGIVLDIKGRAIGSMPLGHFLVACSALTVAIGGFLGALGCPRRPAADSGARFPWQGPVATLKVLGSLRKDRLLTITVAIATFVWFLGVFQVLLVTVLGQKHLGVSKTLTSLLAFAEMIGIAAGGLLAGWLTTRWKWYRLLSPAAVLLGLAMMGLMFVPANVAPGDGPIPRESLLLAGGLLLLAGAAGGMMLIPLESFVQVRPRAQDRGSVIAAANCAEFIGISIAGAVFALLYPTASTAATLSAHAPAAAFLAPTIPFGVLGAVTVAVGLAIAAILKQVRE